MDLRELRKKQEMTLAEVGLSVGIHASYLSNIETGRSRLTEDLRRKLAHLYGVSPNDITAKKTADKRGKHKHGVPIDPSALKAAREKAGYSLSALAEMSEVSGPVLSKHENGKVGIMRIENAERVAAVLGVTVSDLTRPMEREAESLNRWIWEHPAFCFESEEYKLSPSEKFELLLVIRMALDHFSVKRGDFRDESKPEPY